MFSQFSHKTLFVVIAIVTCSLVGLVVIQVKWLRSAITVYEQEFNDRICSAVFKAEEVYHRDLHPRFGQGSTEARIATLKTLLADEFNRSNLPADFIIDLREMDAGSKFPEHQPYGDIKLQFMCSYALSIYFPSKNRILLSELSGTLAPSILFVVLLISCFAYVILTLRRQKRLSEIKNDFINNLTHEFQTPLSSIALTSRVIQKKNPDRFDEKDKQYFGLIENETARLKGHIDKVLQMAQIDAGVFVLDKTEVNIHQVISRVAQNFETVIREAGGNLVLELNADRPILFCDETHLINLVYNLVDNATKYSLVNPEITIATANTTQGFCICVRDKGIGIREDVQKYIFEKFYRVPTGDVHNAKGFGLGLNYVRAIVNAHKGKITLKSEIDKGSEFQIVLPAL